MFLHFFLHLFYSFTYKMSISLFFLIVVCWFFFIYFYQEWTTSFCLKCFGIVILVHYSQFSIKVCLLHLNVENKSGLKVYLLQFINVYCKCYVYRNLMWFLRRSHFSIFSSYFINQEAQKKEKYPSLIQFNEVSCNKQLKKNKKNNNELLNYCWE